ncbi:hypothetical protein ZHAS_00011879 [Anopheles sinensis]|uniref:Uncharacterized protein n=1 Tax=Anopheles sinensis TaxID=74873 RepID=A0A084W1F4_ANOSI|nr:hypothetical protein ZHAS_00011879 [Anopheles sinensis]
MATMVAHGTRLKRDSKVNPATSLVLRNFQAGESFRKQFTPEIDATSARGGEERQKVATREVENLMNFTSAIMKRKSWKKKHPFRTPSGPESGNPSRLVAGRTAKNPPRRG